jgi:hypothetical protein
MGVDAAQAAKTTAVTTSRRKLRDKYGAMVPNNYPFNVASAADEQAQLPINFE